MGRIERVLLSIISDATSPMGRMQIAISRWFFFYRHRIGLDPDIDIKR